MEAYSPTTFGQLVDETAPSKYKAQVLTNHTIYAYQSVPQILNNHLLTLLNQLDWLELVSG
jgi:hypothetical protein